MVLLLLCGWLSLAGGHSFEETGGGEASVNPANLDLKSSKSFKTATFALG